MRKHFFLKNHWILLIASVFVLALTSCTNQTENNDADEQQLTIAVSKISGPDSYYEKWVHYGDSSIRILNLYNHPLDTIYQVLEQCDGVLLTGGEDINPDYYGAKSRLSECGEIDYRRDTLEFIMLDHAFRNKMPVLGVCRGQQMINVFLGGSLYIDLPTDRPSAIHHRCAKSDTCFHSIRIDSTSLLYSLTNSPEIQVNSSHHQAIDVPAINIQALAWSPDSIIEAISWENPKGRSYMFATQFHPERMDYTSSVSGKIIQRFVNEMLKYKQSH